jgi:hypothetical protein
VWGIVVKLEIIDDGVNYLTTLAKFLMVVHFLSLEVPMLASF